MLFCPYCGKQFKDGDSFCRECGKKFPPEVIEEYNLQNQEFDIFGDLNEDDFFLDDIDSEDETPKDSSSTEQTEQPPEESEKANAAASETLDEDLYYESPTEELSPEPQETVGITEQLAPAVDEYEQQEIERVSAALGRAESQPFPVERSAILDDDDEPVVKKKKKEKVKKEKPPKPVKEKGIKRKRWGKEEKNEEISSISPETPHRGRRRSAREEEHLAELTEQSSKPVKQRPTFRPEPKIQKIADTSEDEEKEYSPPEEYSETSHKSIAEAALNSAYYADEAKDIMERHQEEQDSQEKEDDENEGRRKLEVKPIKRRKRERNYEEIDLYKLEQEQADIADSDYDGYYETILPIDHDRDRKSFLTPQKIVAVLALVGVLVGVVIFSANMISSMM